MAARDRAVLPYERAVFNAARRAQRQIADEFKRRIRTSSKEEAGGLDLEDDDEGREVVVNGYRQLVPIFERTFRAGGVSGLSKARVNLSFDVRSPRAERLLLEAENKFFDEVSDTAWQSIKRKLSKALEEGSNIDDLTQIVESELDVGVLSPGKAEAIARTQVIKAYNQGLEEGFRQSGVVSAKVWLAALDDRTRPTHLELHETQVGLDEDFVSSSGASGPGPGQLGTAEEDISCRCALEAILGDDSDSEPSFEEIPSGVNETEVLE